MSREQKRLRKRARAVNSSVIGTHAAANSRRAARTNVNFGNQRGAQRAVRGEISHVVPHTRTSESHRDYSRRSHRRDYVEANMRRRRRRRVLGFLAVVVVAIVAVVSVSRFVYATSIDGQMRISDSDTLNALTSVSADTDPYYTLVVGEFAKPGEESDSSDLLMLMRVDPQSSVVTFVSIPSNITASMSDGNTHTLSQASSIGGDAELISQVSSLMGVKISHFAKIGASSFETLVDELGGVTVTLPEEVDDPRVGTKWLPAGETALDGETALFVCRARNYSNPESVQAQVQQDVFSALLQKALGGSSLESVLTLDTIASDFQTDLSASDLASLAKAVSLNGVTVYGGCVPGSTSSDGSTFSVSSSSLSTLMQTVDAGGDPNAEETLADVDPTGITVSVRNGAGITGAASTTANEVTAAGYTVSETGNTETYVYDETLIIYSSDDMADAAKNLVNVLGCGRVTSASAYYSFSSDILIVIGKDWVAN